VTQWRWLSAETLNIWHPQEVMEAPWEDSGSTAVEDGNHIRFTAVCFNVLKELAPSSDDGVIVVLRFPTHRWQQ